MLFIKEYTHTKMKKVFTILTLLGLFLLFGKGEVIYADTTSVPPESKACLCSSCEDHTYNHHTGYSFDQESKSGISSLSRNSRNLGNENERLFKTAVKLFENYLQKEDNTLQHISENRFTYHSLNYSSLRNRSGYLVFALRKILI